MNKFVHFMYVPMTGLGLFNGYRGDGWLKDRLTIFKEYVVPSLKSQTVSQSLYVWFSWRPEEETNPVVKDFIEYTKLIRGLEFVHTFGGVCFWDDKYTDQAAAQRLLKSLTLSLPHLKNHVGDFPYVLMTIQPSDDMYRYDSMQRVQEKASELIENGQTDAVIGYRAGYVVDYSTKTIAEWMGNDVVLNGTNTLVHTIPPFFTHLFPSDVFLDPHKHYDYTGPYKSHEYVGDTLKYYQLPGRGFMVGTHGANISTTFNHHYAGRRIEAAEKDRLMMEFGIYDCSPLNIRKRPHIYIRTILNKLPRKVRYYILKLYYSRSWTKQNHV